MWKTLRIIFLRHIVDVLTENLLKLPFKEPSVFGDTLRGAVSRLSAMERKFSKNDALFSQYEKFLNEYLSLNHMIKILPSEVSKNNMQL